MNRKFILLCLAAVLVIGAVVGVAACGNTDPIVGTWVSEDGSKYVFEKTELSRTIFLTARFLLFMSGDILLNTPKTFRILSITNKGPLSTMSDSERTALSGTAAKFIPSNKEV